MKNIKIMIAVLACFTAAAVWAQKKPGAQSGDLKQIVIEGTPRMQMRGDKPLYVPELNPKEPVETFLNDHISENNPIEKILVSFPPYLPPKLGSDIVLSPWHGKLVQSPVLYLMIKQPAGIKIAQWRMVITDDQGKVFRMIKGKGNMPKAVSWDGFSESGQQLKVGHSYAYSLSVLDESDVPTYLFGKTINVGGFAGESGGKMTLSLDTKILFIKGPAFSPQGKAYMLEARDWLRKVINWKISINIYDDDVDLAQRQAEMIMEYLEKSLHISKGFLSANGKAPDKSRYLRTEIIARKF